MSQGDSHYPRKALRQVTEALADTRVVVVNGARQVGKSTLALAAADTRAGTATRFLDHPQTRAAAQVDPVSFLRHDGLLVIDEVQRVPELWLAIKETVDRDPRPGRFLLTGSARLLALRSLPDALPGRSETIELWPLSQGELDQEPDGFVDAAFTLGTDLVADHHPADELTRADYLRRAVRGGYPEAVRRDSPQRRRRFFASYLADLMSRDIHQVADIQHSAAMSRLLSLLAGQVGGMLNQRRLADDLAISAPTVSSYLSILETVFLVRLIPAYASSATTRTVGAPKVSLVDSGLAAQLTSGMSGDALTGGLLENFVIGELGRQLGWADTAAQLFHYRDRDRHEVDVVLEDNLGRVVGVEVKAGATVRADDFRSLARLRDRLGDRFVAGFVLSSSSQRSGFGDRLAALPLSALWTTAAGSTP